ncbi:MAG: signal peptidase I [Dehalococcoidia bacterium]|nr:signal peptidase I [Dehalococcoidia bacterium]
MGRNWGLKHRIRKPHPLAVAGKWLGGIVLVVVVTTALLGFGLPYAAGAKWLTVLSGSMTPTLDVGGLVLVWPIDDGAIKEGDIIAFHPPTDPEVIVAHRVIEVRDTVPRSFQTKGDANEDADSYTVEAAAVVGEVRFHVAGAGRTADRIKDFAGSQWVFPVFLGLPGALIIASEMRTIASALDPRTRRSERWKEMEEKRRKKRRALMKNHTG